MKADQVVFRFPKSLTVICVPTPSSLCSFLFVEPHCYYCGSIEKRTMLHFVTVVDILQLLCEEALT